MVANDVIVRQFVQWDPGRGEMSFDPEMYDMPDIIINRDPLLWQNVPWRRVPVFVCMTGPVLT